MKFSDRVALITGGSSGIGLETGRLLSQEGAHVWLLARQRDRLGSALAQVESARQSPHQRCGALIADVTDADQVTAAITEVTKACGAPDILVNCAGDVYPGLFPDTDIKVVRWLMEVNYYGTVNATRACLPAMIARRSGHIVNISSVYGFIGGYGYSAYSASKFAVRGFSDALRSELKPLGISVSIVFPQNTATPQLERENQLKSPVLRSLDNTRVMTPHAVARAIVRGIARRQYVIIPGAEGRLLFWLSGLLGTGTYWVLDRLVARAQKRAQEKPKG